MGLVGTSPAEDPPPRGWQRGKDQRKRWVGLHQPISSQPGRRWGARDPGWPHPTGLFQVGQGVGGWGSFIPVWSSASSKSSRGRESRGPGGVQKGDTGSSGVLWSGGTPLPQLLDEGFNDLFFHLLQFLPHLFQKLLLHSLQFRLLARAVCRGVRLRCGHR